MKTLLFAILTLAMASALYSQSKPVTYVGVTPTGKTVQLNTDANGNLITVSGSGGSTVSGTVQVSNFPATQPTTVTSGTVSLSGTQIATTASYVSTGGTIPAGTQSYSLTFSGTNAGTITSGSIALSGTGALFQIIQATMGNGNTYPATPYTVTSGSGVLIYNK